jgi:hypothetical protein
LFSQLFAQLSTFLSNEKPVNRITVLHLWH